MFIPWKSSKRWMDVCASVCVCVPSCCAEHCLYIVGRISWGTLWWGVALPRGREAEWSTSPAFLLSLFTKPRLLSGNFLSHAVSVHLWHVAAYRHWPASDTGMHCLLFCFICFTHLKINDGLKFRDAPKPHRHGLMLSHQTTLAWPLLSWTCHSLEIFIADNN